MNGTTASLERTARRGVTWARLNLASDASLQVGSRHLPFDGVDSLRRFVLGPFNALIVHGANKTIINVGIGRSSHRRAAEIDLAYRDWLLACESRLNEAARNVQCLLESNRYLSANVTSTFFREHLSDRDQLLARSRALRARGVERSTYLDGFLADPVTVIAARNQRWAEAEVKDWRAFFNNVEKTPLTDEQAKAVVDFEDRNLLIAAAGSGKSSTLIAKVGYALTKGLVRPSEVLALAFNRKAADELKERLQKRLVDISGVSQIESQTFHALGKNIISQVRGKPNIDDEEVTTKVAEAYNRLYQQDLKFRADALFYIVLFTPIVRTVTEFSSVQEYREHQRSQCARPTGPITSLAGHSVASYEEQKIADWLYINGIAYEYERPYSLSTRSEQKRQYTPDFYYPQAELWHEHFGVDGLGRPAPFMNQKDYLEGMEWKRDIHARQSTRLIETTSAMLADGSLFSTLQQQLGRHGIFPKPLAPAELEDRVSARAKTNFTKLLASFITHWKSSEKTYEELSTSASLRESLFLSIAKRVYDAYEQEMTRRQAVDFEDLILDARNLARDRAWLSPYKLVLVDEFQDISKSRASLVREIVQQHPDCVLFCVGDDWQAINGFAGSNLDIMLNFTAHFGAPNATNYLTKTFRSNQGIADAARTFVEKNPRQYKKAVGAADGNAANVIDFRRYRDDKDVAKIYEDIARELQGLGAQSVRVLGRYRKNASSPGLNALSKALPGAAIEFNTMHGSKGLESDYVIIDRMENSGQLSFPSQMSDDPMLRLVTPEKDDFPHAEERRLMYVALTRAKHKVFVLIPDGPESGFAAELMGILDVERTSANAEEAAEPCAFCKRGEVRYRNGKFGHFFGCSRFPHCTYTRKVTSAPQRAFST